MRFMTSDALSITRPPVPAVVNVPATVIALPPTVSCPALTFAVPVTRTSPARVTAFWISRFERVPEIVVPGVTIATVPPPTIVAPASRFPFTDRMKPVLIVTVAPVCTTTAPTLWFEPTIG